MNYKIVLVPFPFDDLSGVKVRPALCLTPKISKYDHIVIAFITSNIQIANEPSDFVLHSSEQDFKKTGLKLDSAVRLHRLATIPTRIIARELGELPDRYEENLKSALKKLFDL